MILTGCNAGGTDSSIQESSDESGAQESGSPSLLVPLEGELSKEMRVKNEELRRQEEPAAREWGRQRWKELSIKAYEPGSLPGVTVELEKLEGLELVKAAYSDQRYLAIARREEQMNDRLMIYTGKLEVYARENQAWRHQFTIELRPTFVIQDVVMTEKYLFWSEHVATGGGWRISCIAWDQPEEAQVILDSEEYKSIVVEPRLYAVENQLIVALCYMGSEYDTVCRYDPETREWQAMYTMMFWGLRFRGEENVLYGVDYDGKQWYGTWYNMDTQEMRVIPLWLDYQTEGVFNLEFVGDWVVYRSDLSILYVKNYRTGECRKLAEIFSYRGLGDRYVVLTQIDGLFLYDLEQDQFFEIDSEGRECGGAFYSSGEMTITLDCKKEEGDQSQRIIRIYME